MKSHSRFALLATMTLSLALGAVACLNSSAERITLKLKPGQTIRYKTVTENVTDSLGTYSEIRTTTLAKTEVISASGDWTKLRVSTESVEQSGDTTSESEAAIEAMKAVVVTFQVNDRGLTRNMKLENTEDIDPALLQTLEMTSKATNFIGYMGINFPAEPIDTGSKWEVKLKGSDMFGEGGIFASVDGVLTISFKVLGFENIKGKRQIKIESTMEGDLDVEIASPGGDIPATMELETTATLWVEVATGLVTKMTSVGAVLIDIGFGTIEQDVKATIERID